MTAATADAPLLARLKRETAALHARAEAALRLLDDDLTVDRYRRLLAALLGFHRPLEPALWSHAPTLAALGLDGAERRKTPLLVRDLRDLGLDDATIAALPDCAALPDVGDPSRALGALYVLEGATLGGRVVGRHLARTVGATAAHAGAYFASYGDRVGPMWIGFRSALTRYVAECGGDEGAVVGAAVETFEAIGDWMGGSAAGGGSLGGDGS